MFPSSPPPKESLSWSVSALVHALADTLKARFSSIAVRGEISGFSRAASGHCYFTLKDDASQIRCAMFQRAANLLSFRPANGDEIELRGRIAIYEQRGELQLIVESMQPVGQGRLLEQFQQLKTKLEQEGLFNSENKKDLPSYPQTVGVVSSLQAAALHDVLTTFKRRAPHINIIVYPTAVQGTQATAEIVKAIKNADQRGEVDSLIVCRGGGSIEDLWCFNEEAVVRAIAACQLPIIAGIGHETDFTLADFAADVRAPTPTAAAELTAYPQLTLLTEVEGIEYQLQKQLHALLDHYAQRLDRAGLAMREPTYILGTQKQKVTQASLQLRWATRQMLAEKYQTLYALEKCWQQHALGNRVQTQQQKVTTLSTRLSWLIKQNVNESKQQLTQLETRLKSLDPTQVLSRGYAWISDDKGRVVSSAKQLKAGQHIQAQFADGKAQATVLQSEPDLLSQLSSSDSDHSK